MNNNQQKQKTSKTVSWSSILIILLISIIMVSSSIGLYAWAKYQSAVNGSATADVAKWTFKLVDGITETSDVIDFEITRTDGNKHVIDGLLAPGTYGEFDIGIDAIGTETSLEYTIDVTLQNKPRNLKLYSDSEKTKEITVVNNEFTVKGFMSLEDVKEIRIEKIYWEWPYETGTGNKVVDNDVIDTEDAAKTVEMQISVTGTQVAEESGVSSGSEITPSNYGDLVNYSVTVKDGVQVAAGTEGATTLDNWKVFYNDGTNVYIIYGDYMPNAAVNTEKTGMMVDGIYRAYWSPGILTEPRNEAAVAILTNTDNWSQLVTPELASKGTTATGGATIDIWVNSWNQKGYTKLYTSKDEVGYIIGTTENPTSDTSVTSDIGSLAVNKIDEKGAKDKLYCPHEQLIMDPNMPCLGYWLAAPDSKGSSPDQVHLVDYSGSGNNCGNPCIGLRGVICLPLALFDGQDANGVWQLKVN